MTAYLLLGVLLSYDPPPPPDHGHGYASMKPYADLACTHCGHRGSTVKNSRGAKDYIRRRRKCLKCGKRFTTRELPEDQAMLRLEVARRLQIIEAAILQLRDDLDLTTAGIPNQKSAPHLASHSAS